MGQKLKTRKTLMKRIRITKNGKLVRRKTQIGHLKVKWDSSRTSRKNRTSVQEDRGHKRVFKKLLAGAGRRIK
jgi:ribosomal protein L35